MELTMRLIRLIPKIECKLRLLRIHNLLCDQHRVESEPPDPRNPLHLRAASTSPPREGRHLDAPLVRAGAPWGGFGPLALPAQIWLSDVVDQLPIVTGPDLSHGRHAERLHQLQPSRTRAGRTACLPQLGVLGQLGKLDDVGRPTDRAPATTGSQKSSEALSRPRRGAILISSRRISWIPSSACDEEIPPLLERAAERRTC